MTEHAPDHVHNAEMSALGHRVGVESSKVVYDVVMASRS